ncbi:hypothetical protein Dfer_4516 [Dyadobacter fermentans DSM 18053]|uniref:Uncharacterized protein n=1 Tax=Dyadobacter fermentans (strain ATCC 700827 / DSM 18053 / CIP 107007 / KCTC 52180 / NS114) TaxID=471854 RepID=C6W304_DYAFD|nr:hypothetical protein Dfer_4516 [Dyadobacter fermentans DSM 18053]
MIAIGALNFHYLNFIIFAINYTLLEFSISQLYLTHIRNIWNIQESQAASSKIIQLFNK